MNARCEIRLLGGLSVVQGDRRISRFRTHKTAALLARLAHRAGRSHPREELIDLLWPEDEPDLGRNSLSKALSSLRHQLEPPGVRMGAVIVADRETVRLNAAAVWVDVAEFETALRTAARGADVSPRPIEHLRRAIDLYAGDLLPGYYEDWSLSERDRLRDLYMRALAACSELHAEAGHIDDALECARRAAAADPLSEDARYRLMRLLRARGEAALALREYRSLEGALREQLGSAPSRETVALARACRREAADSDLSDDDIGDATPRPAPAPVDARAQLLEGTVTVLVATASTDATPNSVAELAAFGVERGGRIADQSATQAALVFARSGDALECALAAVRGCTAPREGGPPAMAGRLRIGLHTADAAADRPGHGGDVLGVARRFSAVASPGQVLCSATSAALFSHSAAVQERVRVRDIGAYRLVPAAAAEHVFQITDACLDERAYPPVSAEPAAIRAIPLRLDGFFGRCREIAVLHEWLSDPRVRLITLTGPGGCGKTRLAVETADRLPVSDQRPVWFVPLAEAYDEPGITAGIHSALGLPAAPRGSAFDQIAAALAQRTGVLILDNVEQAVEPAAGVVKQLLSTVAGITVVATSRTLLGLQGEREFHLAPLPTPQGANTLEQLTMYDSVQLFLDRAQQARPDFQVTAANAVALAALCDQLEGIPLAIELAAARAQVLTPAQMLVHMDDRFEFLASRRRDLEERHRTLRAAIDWSFRLLPEELRRFFSYVAVFHGGFTVDDAEQVSGEPLALDFVESLRDCSLLVAQDDRGESRTVRLRMLESVRQYALENAEPQVLGDARTRHADHFLCFAECQADRLLGHGQAEALQECYAEVDNLRAALGHLRASRRPDSAARMAVAMAPFWNVHGHFSEGMDHLTALIHGDEGAVPAELRMRLHHWAAVLAYGQGDFIASEAAHRASLDIARQLGESDWVANGIHGLGWAAFEQGRYGEAGELFLQAMEIRESRGDEYGLQSSLLALGVVMSNRAEYAVAVSMFERAMALQRGLGDERGVAASLNNLGIIARRQARYETARDYYEECLALREKHGDRRSIAAAQSNLGMVLLNLGDRTSARGQFEHSLQLRREIGDRWGVAVSLSNLGILAAQDGDLSEARRLQAEALRVRSELDDRLGIAVCLESFAEIDVRAGHAHRATTLFAASNALRTAIPAPAPASEAAERCGTLAILRERLGDAPFEECTRLGSHMALEDAVQLALGTD